MILFAFGTQAGKNPAQHKNHSHMLWCALIGREVGARSVLANERDPCSCVTLLSFSRVYVCVGFPTLCLLVRCFVLQSQGRILYTHSAFVISVLIRDFASDYYY